MAKIKSNQANKILMPIRVIKVGLIAWSLTHGRNFGVTLLPRNGERQDYAETNQRTDR